jgi:hypothetical protein
LEGASAKWLRVLSSRHTFLSLAGRTASPIGDICLVDLEPVVIAGSQTGRYSYRTIDVADAPADATDHVVVVVVDTILIECR